MECSDNKRKPMTIDALFEDALGLKRVFPDGGEEYGSSDFVGMDIEDYDNDSTRPEVYDLEDYEKYRIY